MKTLLVAVNSKYIHSSLSVFYLANTLPGSGIFECTINQETHTIVDKIVKEKPDLIGFSCYIWNISHLRTICAALKERLPHCTMVFGGPEVSYNPHEHLDLADYVLCGYGEETFPALVADLAAGKSPNPVQYGATGHVPPSPYTQDYLDRLQGRIAYLETSRGCPFSCGFCLSGIDEKPLYFPTDRAKADIVRLANSGTKTIKFVDRTFNANPHRATELWRFILHSDQIPPDICFHFEIGADLLTADQLALLATAPVGKFQLEIGLQSFYEPTLLAVQRKTSVDKLVDNIGFLVDNCNMHIHIDLIVGLPHESLKEFAHSFNRAYGLKANMLQVGFLKLLHGSALRQDGGKYAMIYDQNPPYEIRSLDCMTAEEIRSLKSFEDIVERLHNSGRFTNTVNFLLEATGKTPFALFYDLAQALNYPMGCSLDHFTALVYEAFPQYKGLRDVLVLDRLTFDNSCVLPDCLKVFDPKLRTIKAQLNKDFPLKHGVRRGIALLYTQSRAIFVDYDVPCPVTGHYKIQSIEVNQ